MAKKNVEFKNSQTKPTTERRRTFNEWIDMIYAHVESRNAENYGFNKPSTIKA